jgi:hypothetical protein
VITVPAGQQKDQLGGVRSSVDDKTRIRHDPTGTVETPGSKNKTMAGQGHIEIPPITPTKCEEQIALEIWV